MRKHKLHKNIILAYFVYLAISEEFEVANCKINRKIIIIGAGPSGIAAASKLYENGFTNVTILEAENRIGGRLHTTKFGDYWVDLGAQWVHGVQGNTAFKLAYPLGLLDVQNRSGYDQILYDSAGNVVSNDIGEKFMKFFEKYHVEHSFEENVVYEKTFGEEMYKAFVNNLKDVPELIHDKEKYLHYLELFTLSLKPADSWNDLPTYTSDEFENHKGDQQINWKTRGYGMILEVLMKSFPDPKKELPVRNNTILNTEVTSINYSDSKSDELIKVMTKDGQVYTAEHVIVTVSLGVLKEKHHSLFTPSLPSETIRAIEGIDFGCAGKVYLLFEKPFWKNDDIKTVINGFLWNNNERKVIEQDPEEMWLLGVVGALSVVHKSNVLEMFISSNKYAKAMEKVSEEKVLNQSIQLLERFMGKTHNISKPIAMIRTQWFTNPHFRGSYSYHGLDTKEQKVDPTMLAESVSPENLKILFAGEATSTHRYSTADGAIDSGWAAAEKLIQFYKTEKVEPFKSYVHSTFMKNFIKILFTKNWTFL